MKAYCSTTEDAMPWSLSSLLSPVAGFGASAPPIHKREEEEGGTACPGLPAGIEDAALEEEAPASNDASSLQPVPGSVRAPESEPDPAESPHPRSYADPNSASAIASTMTVDKNARHSATDAVHSRMQDTQQPAQLSNRPGLADDSSASSPAPIKQEPITTPHTSSPMSAQAVDSDAQTSRAVNMIKSEHALRIQSPLRESSVPMPSTEAETAVVDSIVSRKRTAPSKAKKGTVAQSGKKVPPAKRRKMGAKAAPVAPPLAPKALVARSARNTGTPADSSPAQSSPSHCMDQNDEAGAGDDEEDADMDDDNLYCICRKPDNGTFMVGCDGNCDDWFHGKCVGIEERDKNLLDKYICPVCKDAGLGRTTWKRICRRNGCRQPARIGKSKPGKAGSKYCSEECGVAYFQEMLRRTRGREDIAKSKAGRRKSHAASQGNAADDDDLGARGGLLAVGELKALVISTQTADQFKKLGEGVLSPPATPDAGHASAEDEGRFTHSETQALAEIARQKDDARQTHRTLKDRMKFIIMAKEAASRITSERELKSKDYCGYDSRVEWTDSRFAAWRHSAQGMTAFELETLQFTERTGASADADRNVNRNTIMVDVADEELELEVCERKKCARHLEWSKLAVDDVRNAMGENGDRMRGMEKKEKNVWEKAALRRQAGNFAGTGSVEVHEIEPLEVVPQGEALEAMSSTMQVATIGDADQLDLDPELENSATPAMVVDGMET